MPHDPESSDAKSTAAGLRPGQLTELLRDLAHAPEGDGGSAWQLALKPGAVIGRFELVREVGRGGFGFVWEARDRELKRTVAFKAVSTSARPEVVEERLLREAESAARLSHPNIVTLFDVGRAEHGPYLVFELLRGRTLADRLDLGRLSVREALHVASEVAKGVAHAHAMGVVHRDLKPANVFLCDDGQVKVLDFGMAHAFGQRRQDGGTPAFMAPEQWEGAPEDERTDVFALGVLLYRLLASELPFPDDAGKSLQGPGPAPILEVPELPGISDLVARMLEKRPVARPRDAGAVSAALRMLQVELDRNPSAASMPVTTRPRAGLPGLVSELKRRRVVPAMVGYGTFALVALRSVDWLVQTGRVPGGASLIALVALGIGLPASLFLAWRYDLTGQGIRRTPSSRTASSGPVASRRACVAFVLALVGVAAAVPVAVYWLGFRDTAAGRPSTSDGRVLVAVADVVNETGEKDLDVLAGLLVTSLEQSRKLSVMTQARVLDLAVRAGRKDAVRVDETIGRDVGRASEVRALLLPAIRRLGTTYSLELRVIDPVRDRHLFTLSDRSTSKDALLDALDRLSETTRNRLGEGTSEVAGAQVRLGGALTRSIEAYQHYLAGVDARYSNLFRATALQEFRAALGIDPEFGAAHGELAVLYEAYGRPDLAAPSWKAADRNLDHMPEKEAMLYRLRRAHRDPTLAHFSREEALRLGQEIETRFPDDKYALTEVADAYETFDLPQRWRHALRRALELDPAYSRAVYLFIAFDGSRTADALAVARRAIDTRPNAANLAILSSALRASGDDAGAAAAAREALRSDGERNSFIAQHTCRTLYDLRVDDECLAIWRRMAMDGVNEHERDLARTELGVMLAFRGKIRDAVRLLDHGERQAGADPALLSAAHQIGRHRLSAPRALEYARQIPNLQLRRNFLSFLGASDEADRMTVELGGRGHPVVEKWNGVYALMRDRRWDEAAELARAVRDEIQRRDFSEALFGTAAVHAEILLAAGRLTEAAEVWPVTLPCRCTTPLDHAAQYPNLALLRARAMEQLGRTSNAVRELDGVIAFWKEADRDLPVLVEAKEMRSRLSKRPAAGARTAVSRAAPSNSIGVLPFIDLSPGKDQQYFADGVAEEILNALTGVRDLRVAGRTSSFSFKGGKDDVRRIGKVLGVGHVLEGSVRRDGGRVRITVRLVKVGDGYRLWSETFDRELSGIFALQDEIAGAVVTKIAPVLASARVPTVSTTAVPGAYQEVLRGREFERRESVEGLEKALVAFTRACELDPRFALGWAGRARVSKKMMSLYAGFEGDRFQAAMAAAERAIVLAPALAEGYLARAGLRKLDFDWTRAEEDLKRALAYSPGDADVLAEHMQVLHATGRLAEAIATGARAVALDPLHARSWYFLGQAQASAGDLRGARRSLERSLEVAPEGAVTPYYLAVVLVAAGEADAALRTAQSARVGWVRDIGTTLALHSLGRSTEAREALARLNPKTEPYQIAEGHAWLGENDAAFTYLETAIRVHDVGLDWVKHSPLLRGLRGDARWKPILRKLNLPDD